MFYRAFSVVQKVNFSSQSDVSLFWGQLVRYVIFAITRRIMHRLGSFFNMMRISSSATKGTKGVCFCLAVFEKLASKLALVLAPEEVDTRGDTSGDTLKL